MTDLNDLRVRVGDGWIETPKRDGSPSGHVVRNWRPASVDDLIEALKNLGAETTGTFTDHRNGIRKEPVYGLRFATTKPGRYLVYRLPDDQG
jgi:hypothetical protein